MLFQSHILTSHAHRKKKTLTLYDPWAQWCFYTKSACVRACLVALPPDVNAVYDRPQTDAYTHNHENKSPVCVRWAGARRMAHDPPKKCGV